MLNGGGTTYTYTYIYTLILNPLFVCFSGNMICCYLQIFKTDQFWTKLICLAHGKLAGRFLARFSTFFKKNKKPEFEDSK